jgi:hypothetical protein
VDLAINVQTNDVTLVNQLCAFMQDFGHKKGVVSMTPILIPNAAHTVF